MKRTLLILGVWASLAQAQTIVQPSIQESTLAEREARISQAQAQVSEALAGIENRYQTSVRDCWQKFAVNDCQAAARRLRRSQREPWLSQQQSLQAQERQLRLEQRERRLEQKEGAP